MDVYEAIDRRFSVRAYQDRPVEDDKLLRVLEAGRSAPSARNRQEMKLVVVRDPQQRAAVVQAAEQEWMASAPVIIAVVGTTPDVTMYCQVPTDPVDCAIAIDHMTLAAVAEGLGTCWVGHFDQQACCKALGVPGSAKIVELLPLGYPAAEKPQRKRKDMAQLLCHDRFA
ncbi:MAG TPA: nitroreductase family protein [Phycisphaerae bacterium]|nr:nitroreductase family protein [Phycisphaerae bacterium]HUT61841.1 nitroreductase family protein [Phycisphaerae bacterium]